MYTIKQIYRVNQKLIREWNILWENSNTRNYFNSYEWFKNCLTSFRIKKYCILLGYSNHKLCFVLPLTGKSKVYYTIGGKYLDKVSFLYNNNIDQCIRELREYACENGISICLNECNFFVDEQNNILKQKASDNKYIELKEDIKNIIKSKERRHIEQIVKKNSNLSFKVFKGCQCVNIINNVFWVEERSNKIKKKKALFNIPSARDLFSNLASTDFCIVGALYYEDKVIAHMVGIDNFLGNFMAYHMAYDNEYKNLQPGKIVIYELIKYLKSNNYKIFDFSRGNSMLKRHFSNHSKENYNIYINPTIIIRFKVLFIEFIEHLKKKIKAYVMEEKRWKQ